MGRRKLPIQYIVNDKSRRETFKKRIKGLKGKAEQLATLCNARVGVIVMCDDKIHEAGYGDEFKDIIKSYALRSFSAHQKKALDQMLEPGIIDFNTSSTNGLLQCGSVLGSNMDTIFRFPDLKSNVRILPSSIDGGGGGGGGGGDARTNEGDGDDQSPKSSTSVGSENNSFRAPTLGMVDSSNSLYPKMGSNSGSNTIDSMDFSLDNNRMQQQYEGNPVFLTHYQWPKLELTNPNIEHVDSPDVSRFNSNVFDDQQQRFITTSQGMLDASYINSTLEGHSSSKKVFYNGDGLWPMEAAAAASHEQGNNMDNNFTDLPYLLFDNNLNLN